MAIVVGQGNEEDLKQNIKECLSPDEPPGSDETTKASAGDVFPENQGGGVKLSDEETSEDHTLFHNIEYLGSRKIEDPKAESDVSWVSYVIVRDVLYLLGLCDSIDPTTHHRCMPGSRHQLPENCPQCAKNV